jgi:hypothetical protein
MNGRRGRLDFGRERGRHRVAGRWAWRLHGRGMDGQVPGGAVGLRWLRSAVGRARRARRLLASWQGAGLAASGRRGEEGERTGGGRPGGERGRVGGGGCRGRRPGGGRLGLGAVGS